MRLHLGRLEEFLEYGIHRLQVSANEEAVLVQEEHDFARSNLIPRHARQSRRAQAGALRGQVSTPEIGRRGRSQEAPPEVATTHHPK